jgi:hypothetical protein
VHEADVLVRVEYRNRALKVARQKLIIGVEEDYILPAGELQTSVPVSRLAEPAIGPVCAKTRIDVLAADRRGLIIRGVVRNYELEVRERLGEDAVYGCGEKGSCVIRRNADADFGAAPDDGGRIACRYS